MSRIVSLSERYSINRSLVDSNIEEKFIYLRYPYVVKDKIFQEMVEANFVDSTYGYWLHYNNNLTLEEAHKLLKLCVVPNTMSFREAVDKLNFGDKLLQARETDINFISANCIY